MLRQFGNAVLLFSAGLILMTTVIARAADGIGIDPLIDRRDDAILDDYFAEVRQSGMIHAQFAAPQRRVPSVDLEETEEAEDAGRKSPLKAFLLSAAVPGAGQLYTGSKVKAAAFFGLEALAWAGFVVYHGKGEDKTDIYETFADIHWSETRYGDFLERNWGVRDDELVVDDLGYSYFTHHLPDTKTQQYYEMIGKYDQFVFGWDDVDTLATPPTPDNLGRADSPNRHHYENLRHDANVMYGRATASLIVMMANHIISGAEAALAARNHNRNIRSGDQRLSVRATTARLDDSYFPMLTMTYKF
jgi:hypothetical protein